MSSPDLTADKIITVMIAKGSIILCRNGYGCIFKRYPNRIFIILSRMAVTSLKNPRKNLTNPISAFLRSTRHLLFSKLVKFYHHVPAVKLSVYPDIIFLLKKNKLSVNSILSECTLKDSISNRYNPFNLFAAFPLFFLIIIKIIKDKYINRCHIREIVISL